MDDTIFDFIEPMIQRYNKWYNDKVTKSDLTDYDVSKFIRIPREKFFMEYASEYAFSVMKPYPFAKEFVDEVWKTNDVYFVTSCPSHEVPYRYTLLKRYFPAIDESKFIKCSNKQMVNIGILFDDFPKNLVGGSYVPVIYRQPWNENFAIQNEITNWKDALEKYKENGFSDYYSF